MEITKELMEYGMDLEPELIKIRRELHMHPELSRQEVWTSQFIAEQMQQIPYVEVKTALARGTGVMGILRGTKNAEKERCIMVRADIDALPVLEDNDLTFCSVNKGVMHACGHDAHATWIIGCAKILSHFRDRFSGCVKFVFQPGEEQGFGAREMICEDHILENPKVDYAFAAHGWPSIDAGKIGIAKRYAFGCPGGFRVRIKGQGGHGSWPYKAINPIMIAVEICSALPKILADRINSMEPRVISIGSIQGGIPGVGNIIPDSCDFAGTIRATKMDVMEQLSREIEHIISGYCQMYGAEYEYSCHYGESVKNDPQVIEGVMESARDILGEESVYYLEEDNLGGENFAEFSSRVPSTYMFVGIRNESLAKEFDLHSPEYMLDESVLAKASVVFANTVLRFLEEV